MFKVMVKDIRTDSMGNDLFSERVDSTHKTKSAALSRKNKLTAYAIHTDLIRYARIRVIATGKDNN